MNLEINCPVHHSQEFMDVPDEFNVPFKASLPCGGPLEDGIRLILFVNEDGLIEQLWTDRASGFQIPVR